MRMTPSESLPPGSEAPWAEWRFLNRLMTQVGRSKTNMKKWGYLIDGNVLCECGAEQIMAHIVECHGLEEAVDQVTLPPTTMQHKGVHSSG